MQLNPAGKKTELTLAFLVRVKSTQFLSLVKMLTWEGQHCWRKNRHATYDRNKDRRSQMWLPKTEQYLPNCYCGSGKIPFESRLLVCNHSHQPTLAINIPSSKATLSLSASGRDKSRRPPRPSPPHWLRRKPLLTLQREPGLPWLMSYLNLCTIMGLAWIFAKQWSVKNRIKRPSRTKRSEWIFLPSPRKLHWFLQYEIILTRV